MKTFLILEDEPLIAMDLQMAFEDAGHLAVTAIDNDEAAHEIDTRALAAAVLDVSLGAGKTSEPTAEKLAGRNIPFLLHTGDLNRAGEHLKSFDVPICMKPVAAEMVVRQVVALHDPHDV